MLSWFKPSALVLMMALTVLLFGAGCATTGTADQTQRLNDAGVAGSAVNDSVQGLETR